LVIAADIASGSGAGERPMLIVRLAVMFEKFFDQDAAARIRAVESAHV
jgi:hypothetical protein